MSENQRPELTVVQPVPEPGATARMAPVQPEPAAVDVPEYGSGGGGFQTDYLILFLLSLLALGAAAALLYYSRKPPAK